MLDGQIRELEEPYEVGSYTPMHPGDFGEAKEDCNCRCLSLKRARWALDEDELKVLRERAVRHSLYSDDPKAFRAAKLPALKSFPEFQKSYLKAAQTLDNPGKSGIISSGKKSFTKIQSSDIPPMDEGTFNRIKSSLSRKGVKIIQDEDGDAFLRYMDAEAITLSDGSGILFQSGRIPSASAMYEELIHVTQIKQKGAVASDDVIEYLKREIEANEKALKNRKAYKLTELDVQSVERNLDYYYKRLKEVTGNVQDED